LYSIQLGHFFPAPRPDVNPKSLIPEIPYLISYLSAETFISHNIHAASSLAQPVWTLRGPRVDQRDDAI